MEIQNNITDSTNTTTNNIDYGELILDSRDASDHFRRYIDSLKILPFLFREESYLRRQEYYPPRSIEKDPADYLPTLAEMLIKAFKIKSSEELEIHEEFSCSEGDVNEFVKLLDMLEFFSRREHIRCGVGKHFECIAGILEVVIEHYEDVITSDFNGLVASLETEEKEQKEKRQ